MHRDLRPGADAQRRRRRGLLALGVALLACGLLVAPPGSAAVYKWVDDKGVVHYGDCPPAECGSQEVQVAPGQSDKAFEEAQERLQRLKEYTDQGRRGRQDKSRTELSAPTLAPPQPDGECFSSLEKAWGGRVPDSREAVPRTPLSEAELSELRDLLGGLEGRRRASMEETECIAPDATPPEQRYRYEADLEGRWQSKNLFRLQADLLGLDNRTVSRQYFWFLLSPEGLRFKADASDSSFDLDAPGNDAGTLSATDERLTLFWREGGRVRRASVLSLGAVGHEYRLREFGYTQGELSGKRLWVIDR